MSLIKRLRLETEDRLRWHPAVRNLLFQRALKRARRGRGVDAVNQLCAAARLAPNTAAMQKAEASIHERLRELDLSKVDWRRHVNNIERRRIEKAVVLKPCVGPKEKGVVFISFEDQWARLAWQCDLAEFADRYSLVVSPTWSPPHHVVNCLFPAAYPGPIFCLISNTNDLTIFPRLSQRYVMIPLFASSWVNPALYRPVPFEKKDLDLFMLANFGKYKRHFLLFKALRDMPTSTRVLLIGQQNGDRTGDTIRAEARAYGVEHRFELLVNASNETVLDAFCRAKTTAILSRREGSCVAVVESMFANTPVGIFEDAEIGSRVYINESTGRFFQYRNLGRQLTDWIANAGNYRPRPWAEKNISCYHSTTTLNEALKSHALAAGQDWTQDIAPHHWRPDPQLIMDEDRARMRSSYDDIRTRFGLTLGTD